MAQPATRTSSSVPFPEATPRRGTRFRYGSRIVHMPQGDGTMLWREVPLTVDDFLDPEEGDLMVQGNWHDWVLSALSGMLRRWLERSLEVTVFSDFKMRWGIPDIPEPAPDVCVVRGLRERRKYRGSLDLKAEGVRPCLLIEVVSPLYRHHDYESKVEIYQRVGIEEYLIIEPREDQPFALAGYHLGPKGRYQLIVPDAGRLLSKTTGLWFSPHPEPDFDRERFVIVEDVATGERLRTAGEEAQARRDAEARAAEEAAARRQAEARAQEGEAEVERLKKLLASREPGSV